MPVHPLPTPHNENAPPCEISDNPHEEVQVNQEFVANGSEHKVGFEDTCNGQNGVLSAVLPSIGQQTQMNLDGDKKKVSESNFDLTQNSLPAKADLEKSKTNLKMIENPGELFPNLGSHAASSSDRYQLFKEGLQKKIIRSCDLGISFQNFPYFLRLYFYSKQYICLNVFFLINLIFHF